MIKVSVLLGISNRKLIFLFLYAVFLQKSLYIKEESSNY